MTRSGSTFKLLRNGIPVRDPTTAGPSRATAPSRASGGGSPSDVADLGLVGTTCVSFARPPSATPQRALLAHQRVQGIMAESEAEEHNTGCPAEQRTAVSCDGVDDTSHHAPDPPEHDHEHEHEHDGGLGAKSLAVKSRELRLAAGGAKLAALRTHTGRDTAGDGDGDGVSGGSRGGRGAACQQPTRPSTAGPRRVERSKPGRPRSAGPPSAADALRRAQQLRWRSPHPNDGTANVGVPRPRSAAGSRLAGGGGWFPWGKETARVASALEHEAPAWEVMGPATSPTPWGSTAPPRSPSLTFQKNPTNRLPRADSPGDASANSGAWGNGAGAMELGRRTLAQHDKTPTKRPGSKGQHNRPGSARVRGGGGRFIFGRSYGDPEPSATTAVAQSPQADGRDETSKGRMSMRHPAFGRRGGTPTVFSASATRPERPENFRGVLRAENVDTHTPAGRHWHRPSSARAWGRSAPAHHGQSAKGPAFGQDAGGERCLSPVLIGRRMGGNAADTYNAEVERRLLAPRA